MNDNEKKERFIRNKVEIEKAMRSSVKPFAKDAEVIFHAMGWTWFFSPSPPSLQRIETECHARIESILNSDDICVASSSGRIEAFCRWHEGPRLWRCGLRIDAWADKEVFSDV